MLQGVHNWTSNNIYVLNQKVVVDSEATLNIEAGTIIKGTAGQGSLASALVIARGGMINANGTENSPIIFTSVSDNIEIGQSSGTNLGPNDQGLWGGVLILGNAPCSFSGDVSELQIEEFLLMILLVFTAVITLMITLEVLRMFRLDTEVQ